MDNISRIQDMGLMNEMLDYSPIEFKTVRAAKVYMNCIRMGHFKWAEAIERKHAKQKRYDIVEAMKYSLMTYAHQQKNKS